MNYYRRYVGDYMRDTAHLSLAEVGAYDRLLDAQYATEKPLPVDVVALCRICRAHSKEECDAVESVAAQFFPVVEGGRWNPRARRELIAAQPAIAAARANGALGGRPRANPPGNPPGLAEEPNGLHPPTTNHQPPTTNHQPSKENPKNTVGLTPDATPPVSKKAELTAAAERVLAFLNEKTGARYRPVEGNLEMMRARLREGFTEADLRGVVAKKCREWSGDDEMAKYLRPATLFNRTKFAQYHGEKR